MYGVRGLSGFASQLALIGSIESLVDMLDEKVRRCYAKASKYLQSFGMHEQYPWFPCAGSKNHHHHVSRPDFAYRQGDSLK